jgi:hypothetical protein
LAASALPLNSSSNELRLQGSNHLMAWHFQLPRPPILISPPSSNVISSWAISIYNALPNPRSVHHRCHYWTSHPNSHPCHTCSPHSRATTHHRRPYSSKYCCNHEPRSSPRRENHCAPRARLRSSFVKFIKTKALQAYVVACRFRLTGEDRLFPHDFDPSYPWSDLLHDQAKGRAANLCESKD